MDRCTFLSSLPFLIKLSSSSSWPPSPPTDLNHNPVDVFDKHDVKKKTNNNNESIHDSTNHHPPAATILLGETDQYNRSFYMSIEDKDLKNNGTTKIMKQSNKNISDIQAAYFVRSSTSYRKDKETNMEYRVDKNTTSDDDNDDSAMVSIQIAVYEQRNENLTMQMISSEKESTTRYNNNNSMFHRNTTPIHTNSSKHRNSYNNSMTTATSYRSPTPNRMFGSTNDRLRQQLGSPTVQSSFHRSIMYLKVKDHIFALDMSQLKNCEVLSEVYQDHPNISLFDKDTTMDIGYDKNESDTMIRKSRPMIQPPSLILYFDSNICFRIFSLPKLSSYQNDDMDNKKERLSYFPSRDDILEEIETLQIIHDKIQYIFQQQHDIMQQQSLYGSRKSMKDTTSIKLQEADVISPTATDDVSGSSSSRNSSNSSSTPPLGIGQKYSDDINNNSSVTTTASRAEAPRNEAVNHDDISSSNNNQQNEMNPDSIQEYTRNKNEIEHDLIKLAIELPEHNSYKRRKLTDQKLHDLLNQWHMNAMSRSIGIHESRGKDGIQTDNTNVHDDYMTSIGKTLNRVAELQGESYLSESIVESIESHYEKQISDNHDQLKYYGNIFYPMTGKRNSNNSSTRNRGVTSTAGMIGSSQDRYNNTHERNNNNKNDNTTTGDEHNNSNNNIEKIDDPNNRKIHSMSDNKEFMNTVQRLLSKNKLLCMEKYKVSLMPERG